MRQEYVFGLQRFGGDDIKKKLLLRERKKKKKAAFDAMRKGHIQKGKRGFQNTQNLLFYLCAFGMFNAKFYGGNIIVGKGKLEDVIYLGSQRAFDEILHKRLLRKLANHKAGGKDLSIMG